MRYRISRSNIATAAGVCSTNRRTWCSLSLIASWACAYCRTSAASSISGTEMARKNSCSPMITSGMEPVANGPRPAFVFSMVTSATASRCKPSPPGPKRTADHNSNGNGMNSNH